jgi:hypothetical protein
MPERIALFVLAFVKVNFPIGLFGRGWRRRPSGRC